MSNTKKYVKLAIALVLSCTISLWLYWRGFRHLEFLYPYLGFSLSATPGALTFFDIAVYLYSHIIGFAAIFLFYCISNATVRFRRNHMVTKIQKTTGIVILSIFAVGFLMMLLGSSLACTLFMFGCYILFEIYFLPVKDGKRTIPQNNA